MYDVNDCNVVSTLKELNITKPLQKYFPEIPISPNYSEANSNVLTPTINIPVKGNCFEGETNKEKLNSLNIVAH